jgi:hypothetical protein
MRTVTKFKKISVTEDTYDRIVKDRKHFQETIGGGIWSISDTIDEYIKILNQIKHKEESEEENDILPK